MSGNQLPPWDQADLPRPSPLGWRHWKSFIGPGLLMMGANIGGGEWLFGPEVTARFGGSLMWLATVAIVCQVFYNIETGRYALYCGEPTTNGFMRTWPGPRFWVVVYLLLGMGAFLPGFAFNAATICAALYLDRPPTADDALIVQSLGYVCLVLGMLPIIFGGKVYNAMQAVISVKVVIVFGFVLVMGVLFVSPQHWINVASGFLKFGSVPVIRGEDRNGNGMLDPREDFDRDGHLDVVETVLARNENGTITDFDDVDGDGKRDGENIDNIFLAYARDGEWPLLLLTQIALLAAFAATAGGGGLGNSLYSNYVRDKGWGMGSQVGAIPSAVGGKTIQLSHTGKVFSLSEENLARWKGWWRYILTDQIFVWMPGCFIGMGLPALMSIEFSQYSELHNVGGENYRWAAACIMADGVRHAFDGGASQLLWIATLLAGLLVLLPGQMIVADGIGRRWTDVIWSCNQTVRERMRPHQVKYIYYTILGLYFIWCLVSLYYFGGANRGPKLMFVIAANLANVAIGASSFHLLWINCTMLPAPLRPRWFMQLGLTCCGVFYLGLAAIVFFCRVVPVLREVVG